MEKQSFNIYDISEKAGVSIATVSRVLNNSSKVSEKTRRKVQLAMEELNYQPNAFARGLGSGTMYTIGIMCTDATDTFLSAGLQHAERALRKKGYAAILSTTGRELTDRRETMSQILTRGIDGLILVGSSFVDEDENNNEYIRNAAQEVPIVIVNGYMEGKNIYSVSSNDFEAVFHMTDQLLSAGRQNLLHVYSANTYSGRQKIRGFRAAYGLHGIPLSEKQILWMEKDLQKGTEALIQRYQEGPAFDVVIAAEDIGAVAAMKMASECNLRVPEDFQIIGYNNSVLTQCTSPELSSIDNHIQIMAERAVDILIGRLSGEEPEHRELVATELVKRGSSLI